MACIAIASAACGSTAPNPSDEPDGGVCEKAADCDGDQACRSGYCTRRSAEMEGVRFQFSPPQSSGYNPQTTRGVTIRAGDRL
ncbi:MAG: hypothetical protein ABEN55_08145, partial [Bradymonadaceae bacterium]